MDSKVVMTNKIGGMWHPDSKPADDRARGARTGR